MVRTPSELRRLLPGPETRVLTSRPRLAACPSHSLRIMVRSVITQRWKMGRKLLGICRMMSAMAVPYSLQMLSVQ